MAQLLTTQDSKLRRAPIEPKSAVILIDDGDLRMTVVRCLEPLGYGCQIADGVQSATNALIGHDHQLIVADMDGLRLQYSVLTHAQGAGHTYSGANAPSVLAVLTDHSANAIGTALELGAGDVLIVPEELGAIEHRLRVIELKRGRSRPVGEPQTGNDQELLAAAERQARELKLLHQVRTSIANDFDLPSLFQTIVEQVSGAFGYSFVSLYTLDDDAVLTLQHQVGYDDVIDQIPVDRGIAGRVARTGEAALVEEVASDPEFLAAAPEIRSEICVPFYREGEVAGVLNIESAGDWKLGQDDLRLIIEVTGYLNIAVDRNALHTAVRASEQQLRLAVGAAGMGTWVWNPKSGEVRWSDQMGPLYGLPAGTRNISSAEWFSLIHPDDQDSVRHADLKFIRFGSDYDIGFRVILPSGAMRWLEVKGRVIEQNANGEATAIAGVTTDITGRKRLEEERLRLVQLEVERTKANEAQQLITDTLERLTAGFVAVDRDWRITFVNQYAQSLIEPSMAELIGNGLWDVFPEIRDTAVEQVLRTSADSQVVATYETLWPGQDCWIEMHIYPAQDGLSIYLQDATERRRSQDERRSSEARFRSLVQNGSDIILIIGRDGVVRYASPAVERVIGRTPDEIIGSDNFTLAHPQDAKRLRRAFVKAAKTPGVSSPILLRFRHRNGHYRWLEVTATNSLDDPAIQGIVANCRDVTDRHEAEHNLWFLAETSAVLGTSLDVEATLSNISRLVVMNFADMCIVDIVTETGEAEAFAVSHRDVAEEQRLVRLRAQWPLTAASDHGPGFVLRTGQSVLHETIEDESQQLWMNAPVDQFNVAEMGFHSAIIVPLTVRGSATGVLTVASTTPGRFGPGELSLIEELARRAAMAVDNARYYRAARDAIEARDEFLSVAAHELRTPITAINGFSTLLQREVSNRNDPARVQRYARRMKDAGSRLALLVDDMLDVSRIRLGQMPLRVAEIDLVSLVERVTSRYEEQDPVPPHQITFQSTLLECIVPADDDRLEQVLSNVIDNAIKYSPAGGQIDITLQPDSNGFLLQVRDSGMGFPISEIDSIFDPFGRGSNVALSRLPGLGIGLFISRNIVERHHGRIWAESAGEDRGATFSVWLPSSAPPAEATVTV